MANYLYSDDTDHYRMLRIAPDADDDTIRQAYRRLAREFHPDVAGEGSAEMMKQINAAYRVLNDPVKRREYDLRHGFGRVARPFTSSAQPEAPTPFRRTPPQQRPITHPFTQRPAYTNPPQPTPYTTQSSAGPLHLYRTLADGDGVVAALAFAQNDGLMGVGYNDGRIDLWHLASQQRLATLNLHANATMTTRPGVLQELRLSPSGKLAMAWGLNLGTGVWNTLSGQTLWSSAVNAPSGAMDGMLIDTPPMVRLALPAAPLSLAEADPFHWAEEGRLGSEILTRPLEAGTPVSPAWSVPLRCDEPLPPRSNSGKHSRVHLRMFAQDGEALLTFSTGPASATITNASIFHWWNLRQHGRLGAAGPQRQGSVVLPGRVLWYPIATNASATIVATQFEERAIRLYNVQTGQHTELPTGPVASESRMALSADGALLAIVALDMRHIDLWATRTGQRVQTWEVSAPVAALRFATSITAPTLTIGRADGVCEVWSAA